MTQQQAIRRYFFDCEFNENRPTDGTKLYDIDFISIGIVSEDGEAYYAINEDCDPEEAAKHPWLAEHVVPKLTTSKKAWRNISQIRQDLTDFIRPAKRVEFWARNNSYDVVTLCRLFGTMQNMNEVLKAKGVEKVVFRDINEFKYDPTLDWSKLPKKDDDKAHGADYDAGFELVLYRYIMNLKKSSRDPSFRNGPR